jgi:flagellar motor switch protein FliM
MSAAQNVLSRKLSQSGVARSPLPDTELIGETFAHMVEDRLRPLVKSIISAMVTECRVAKLSEALAGVSVPAMLGLVQVEDAETPALVWIDSDLAYHLIDLTLGGDPSDAPAPTARTFTAIDMALCRLHLEATLDAFGEAIGTAFGHPLSKVLRIRDQRQNISQLRIAPDYVDVLILSVALDIGDAARTGKCELILPLSTLDVIRAAMEDRGSEEARERPNDLWKSVMRRAAAGSPVTVDAVLYRQSMSVAALERLEVGQVFELPRQATEEIRLSIPQPQGRTTVLATARLGAYRGAKVVKLTTEPDPRIVDHIERALRVPGAARPALAEPETPEPRLLTSATDAMPPPGDPSGHADS